MNLLTLVYAIVTLIKEEASLYGGNLYLERLSSCTMGWIGQLAKSHSVHHLESSERIWFDHQAGLAL